MHLRLTQVQAIVATAFRPHVSMRKHVVKDNFVRVYLDGVEKGAPKTAVISSGQDALGVYVTYGNTCQYVQVPQ